MTLSTSSYAPICLFTYNRLSHTQKVIESLLKNPEANQSDLFIYSDGPRTETELKRVMELRDFLKNIQGFRSVQIIERDQNWGLAQSIISGVTETLKKFENVIVLEDDLVVSSQFLGFMNTALRLYRDNPKVVCIHGYTFPIGVGVDLKNCFFLRGAQCWGWATWRRGWSIFNSDGKFLLTQLQNKKMAYELDLKGAYPYTQMLKKQVSGQVNSWAIRWYTSAFLADTYTLFPPKSLVQNIGFDGSGENCNSSTDFDVTFTKIELPTQELKVEQNLEIFEMHRIFFKKLKPSFLQRAWRKLQKVVALPKKQLERA